jgi:hypothetical protein
LKFFVSLVYIATMPTMLRAARVPGFALLTAAALCEPNVVQYIDQTRRTLLHLGLLDRSTLVDSRQVYRVGVAVGMSLLLATAYYVTPVVGFVGATASATTTLDSKFFERLASLDHVLPHNYAALFAEK